MAFLNKVENGDGIWLLFGTVFNVRNILLHIFKQNIEDFFGSLFYNEKHSPVQRGISLAPGIHSGRCWSPWSVAVASAELGSGSGNGSCLILSLLARCWLHSENLKKELMKIKAKRKSLCPSTMSCHSVKSGSSLTKHFNILISSISCVPFYSTSIYQYQLLYI